MLKNKLTGYICFEGEGRGSDDKWKPELSLLILGISKENAIKLGKEFEQNAIVYGAKGELPELLILVKK